MKKVLTVLAGAGMVGGPLAKALQKKVGDDIKVVDMEEKDKFLTNVEEILMIKI